MEKKSNKVLLSIIGIALLIVSVVGVTYAFFNYTRTGTENTLRVGDIYFNSEYDNVELSGIFPISTSDVLNDKNNVMTVNVDVEGHTTYEKGLYYEVKAKDVHLTINGKNIPIGIQVTSNNLSNVLLTNYENGKILTNESLFAKGRILSNTENENNSVDGTITIKAYLDASRIAIVDTYDGNESDLMGTTNGWVNGRVVLTTEEWNSFASTPLSFKIKVEAIENNVSTLVDGTTFIGKVKKLANPDLDDSSSNWQYSTNNNITTFERTNEKPDTTGFTDDNVISTIDSAYPIYAWYENGIIKYYSESENIKANTDMSYMFCNLNVLENIGDLVSLDTTNVNNMSYMFVVCREITSLEFLFNWNVSNVTNMEGMFSSCPGITSLEPLSNWNVSNVTNIGDMFSASPGITSLNGLSNWNVSNVTNMKSLFSGCTGIASLEPLLNWNVSNVTNMESMFSRCTGIISLEPLLNWNVSSVTTMERMFMNCTGITSLEPLSNWNVLNVTNMMQMFSRCTGITSLNGLSNWNVSNVVTYNASMGNMFSTCTSLLDASAINDWDIVSAHSNAFRFMFSGDSVHPEFTKRAGTWDSRGTFTPNA